MKVQKVDGLFVSRLDAVEDVDYYAEGRHGWHATPCFLDDSGKEVILCGHYDITGAWSNVWMLAFSSRKVRI